MLPWLFCWLNLTPTSKESSTSINQPIGNQWKPLFTHLLTFKDALSSVWSGRPVWPGYLFVFSMKHRGSECRCSSFEKKSPTTILLFLFLFGARGSYCQWSYLFLSRHYATTFFSACFALGHRGPQGQQTKVEKTAAFLHWAKDLMHMFP